MTIPTCLQKYKPTFEQYKQARKRCGIPNARAALHNAKYMLYRAALHRRWDDAGGDIVDSYDAGDNWEAGDSRVRIVAMPDEFRDFDDLAGDCFDPNANPDVNPNRLEREKREFIDRIERDGVWGFRAECWNGAEWIETDSIWGFVGDDFIGSCYDDDLIESALVALSECLAGEAAQIEASRPDLYAIA